jgi:hypothetical protein
MKTQQCLAGFGGALLVVVGAAAPVEAQGFGIGPRFARVNPDPVAGTASSRFLGGTVRLGASKRTALEVALDYRAYPNDAGTERVRETPLQASVLLFPIRTAISPYLLGGFGVYNRRTDTLGSQGQVLSTLPERKTGIHLGGGAELFFGKHAAWFVDYRYRFVKFGAGDAASQPINIPGSSLVPGLGSVKLSHQGSMWTSGMAFYF